MDSILWTDCSSGTNVSGEGTWAGFLRGTVGIAIITIKGFLFHPGAVPESITVNPSSPEQVHTHMELEYRYVGETRPTAVFSSGSVTASGSNFATSVTSVSAYVER